LPIVIGGFEAQAIAVALERMTPSRPLTHDLMKNFMLAFNVDLVEIVINGRQEGIFYSKLVCSSNRDTIEIDSRTSDALAVAVRFGCPIYTYEEILNQAGVMMDDDNKKITTPQGVPTVTSEAASGENLKMMSTKELQSYLDTVLEQEDYIKAIAIRDELNSREGK
jgi:bifunctional DNase/RNase